MHHSMEADEPTESIDRLKVLLVDDIRDNRILISTILRRYGVEVHCANNGKEGVMKALLGDYDLILMDIQMPVMDGFQATAELRMHGYANPIVAITAHALNEHPEKSLRSGFTAHVTKPVSTQTLWAILSDLCPKIKPSR